MPVMECMYRSVHGEKNPKRPTRSARVRVHMYVERVRPRFFNVCGI